MAKQMGYWVNPDNAGEVLYLDVTNYVMLFQFASVDALKAAFPEAREYRANLTTRQFELVETIEANVTPCHVG